MNSEGMNDLEEEDGGPHSSSYPRGSRDLSLEVKLLPHVSSWRDT